MKTAFKNFSLMAVLFGLFLALAPALAFAQAAPGSSGSGPFDLPANDLSRKTFIEPLFGPIIGSTTTSPLTEIMRMFNGSLLFLGGLLVAYTIVAGTMSTAHDGEMLGKKWSSMWVPIRTALGAAAVMPVAGAQGGWCIAQVIVIWLAMQGAGLANTLWSTFATSSDGVVSAATYNPPISLPMVRNLYSTMLLSSVCVSSQNADNSTNSDLTNFVMGADKYSAKVVDKPDYFAIYYSKGSVAPAGIVFSNGACGAFSIHHDYLNNDGSRTNGSGYVDQQIVDMNGINRSVVAARVEELKAANKALTALADTIVSKTATQESVDKTLNDLLENYSKNVGKAARDAYANGAFSKDFAKRMSDDGWVMAGAYYMQMVKAQDLITRSVTNIPINAAIPVHTVQFSSQVTTDLDRTRAYLAQSSSTPGGVAGFGQSEDTSNWSSRVVAWFINDSTGGLMPDANMNQNPIMMAKGLGDKMTGMAWAGFAAAAAVGAASTVGVLGNTLGDGGVISFMPMVYTLFMALVVPGAVLSTYLPMVPYIMWLGVVLGWAILLIEAVVAAPLWAIVHLAPDGDGIVGRGGQGYMLVLSLVLRPGLAVIGLVAAFALMKPVGFLVNSTFASAFNLSVTPGLFAITSTIAGCIIYVTVMVGLVHRIFTLIHVIPDRLLRWIGGGGDNVLGQEAEAVGGRGGQMAAQGAMTAGLSMGQSMTSGAAQFNANQRQQKELAKQKEIKEGQDFNGKMDSLQGDRRAAAASQSKADVAGNSAGFHAAAMTAGAASQSGYDMGTEQASRDGSPEGAEFREGLAAASQNKNPDGSTDEGAVQNYKDGYGKKALAQSEAYHSAKSKKDAGHPLTPSDQAALKSPPRPFQRTMAAAAQDGKIASEYREKAEYAAMIDPHIKSGSNGDDQSVRAAKAGKLDPNAGQLDPNE
jgi:conjugal transfer/type IV secretion protein DotA/TraY